MNVATTLPTKPTLSRNDTKKRLIKCPLLRPGRVTAAVFGIFWMLTWYSLPALAIEVRVRARTQLTMDVSLKRDGLAVEGMLRDTSGRPISNAEVVVAVDHLSDYSTTTDDDGIFSLLLPTDQLIIDESSQKLAAHYAGDSRYGGSQIEKVVDVRKREVALSITPMPEPLPLNGPAARFLVEAYSAGSPVADLTVVVDIEGLARVQVTTGKEGTAVLEIPADNFSLAGVFKVLAVFEGNSAFNPTVAETKLTVVADSEITLSLDSVESDRVVLSGTVTVGNAAKSDAIVVLETSDNHVARVVSNKTGQFQFELTEQSIPNELKLQSRLRVRASYFPNEPWILSTTSEEIGFPLPGSAPIPLGPLLWPVVGLFTLGGVYRAIRSAVPRRVLQWIRSLPQRFYGDRVYGSRRTVPAITQVAPSTQSRTLVGVVVDGLVDAPISAAHVSVVSGVEQGDSLSVVSVTETGRDGGFAIDSLLDQPWFLRIHADGYVTTDVRIPHSGSAPPARVRIVLVPLRAELLHIYQEFVGAHWADATPWGHLTPREAQTELLIRIRRDHALVREVTALFEVGYFSRNVPTSAMASRLRALVQQIRDKNPEVGT